MTKLNALADLGQSVWYDNIRRALIDSGELCDLIDAGILGITSNPSIFEKAIVGSTDYDQALKGLKTTARWLERLNPDAAASLREGMEETLTVVRLGVPELLRRTLATTNPIESAFSVAENVTRRVKCWREGDMRQRWCIAGLMRAESKFHRVKGHRHMAQLLRALDRLVLGKGLDENRKIA